MGDITLDSTDQSIPASEPWMCIWGCEDIQQSLGAQFPCTFYLSSTPLISLPTPRPVQQRVDMLGKEYYLWFLKEIWMTVDFMQSNLETLIRITNELSLWHNNPNDSKLFNRNGIVSQQLGPYHLVSIAMCVAHIILLLSALISLIIKISKPKVICRKMFIAAWLITGKKDITWTPICTRIGSWIGVYIKCSILCWH